MKIQCNFFSKKKSTKSLFVVQRAQPLIFMWIVIGLKFFLSISIHNFRPNQTSRKRNNKKRRFFQFLLSLITSTHTHTQKTENFSHFEFDYSTILIFYLLLFFWGWLNSAAIFVKMFIDNNPNLDWIFFYYLKSFLICTQFSDEVADEIKIK